MLKGCVEHETILTEGRIIYRWKNESGSWEESTNLLEIPLKPEIRRRIVDVFAPQSNVNFEEAAHQVLAQLAIQTNRIH